MKMLAMLFTSKKVFLIISSLFEASLKKGFFDEWLFIGHIHLKIQKISLKNVKKSPRGIRKTFYNDFRTFLIQKWVVLTDNGS